MSIGTITPQPPPGVEAPPPGPEAVGSRRVMEMIGWLGVGSMAVLLVAWMVPPTVLKAHQFEFRTEAMNNMKQLGLALAEFDSDYNSFPDASTIAEVRKVTRTTWTLGSRTANELYRQLLVTGCIRSERAFYARSSWSHRPDNHFDDEAHALEPGECGPSYIAGLSGSSLPSLPVLVHPLVPGALTFERADYYGGRALILRCDNSVRPEPITDQGVVLLNGKDLFDPGNGFWDGKTPDVKWPEVR